MSDVRPLALVGLLLAAAPLAAAVPPSPSPLTVPAAVAAPLRVVPGVGQFDAATGTARMLFSLDFRASAGEPVAAARAYLAWDAARLGLTPGDAVDAPVLAVSAGRAATVVRFGQRRAGLPVHRAQLAVAVNDDGAISFVSSSWQAGLGEPVNARRLDGAAALDAALVHLGTRRAATLALEPVVRAAGAEARHAWRVLVDPTGDPEGEWEVLIDAESGAVLQAEDTLLYVDATGRSFQPDPLSSSGAAYGDTGYVDGGDADTAQLTAQTFNVTLRDVTFSGGIYSLAGPYASCVDWDTPAGTCPTNATGIFPDNRASDNFEASSCYHHIDSMMRYLNVTLGTPVVPSQYAGGVQYDPRGFQGQDNSSYSSSTGRLRFGEGGVDDAEDADVVIHELGHGIHDWVLAGLGVSQTEGLSEGVGDYFAQSYSWAYPGQWGPGDPEYHWVFSWDGHNQFWGGRVTNWADTHNYPADLVGQVHTDGQFWASCGMRIWQVLGRNLTDAAMVEGLRLTGLSTNQAAAAQAVLQAAWNMDYSPSALQVIQIKYSTAGCGYGVVMPTDANSIFLDGFEYGNSCEWTQTTPPAGC